MPSEEQQKLLNAIQSDLEAARSGLRELAATLTSPPPPPAPPPPPSGLLKGLGTGYWGPQEEADLKALAPQVMRLGQPGEPTKKWSAIGKVIYLQEGDQNGNYNTAGVQAINTAAMVARLEGILGANPDIWALEYLNEPAGDWFWGSGAESAANAAAYCAQLKAIRGALGTSVKLIASVDGGHGGSTAWLRAMLAADPNVLSYFDLGAVHPYGGNREAGTSETESAQGRRTGIEGAHSLLGGKHIAVTEIGWPTNKETGDSRLWSEARQASNITAFINWARATGYIDVVTIYNYRDGAGADGYGLVRADDSRKPSFAALAGA